MNGCTNKLKLSGIILWPKWEGKKYQLLGKNYLQTYVSSLHCKKKVLISLLDRLHLCTSNASKQLEIGIFLHVVKGSGLWAIFQHSQLYLKQPCSALFVEPQTRWFVSWDSLNSPGDVADALSKTRKRARVAQYFPTDIFFKDFWSFNLAAGWGAPCNFWENSYP